VIFRRYETAREKERVCVCVCMGEREREIFENSRLVVINSDESGEEYRSREANRLAIVETFNGAMRGKARSST